MPVNEQHREYVRFTPQWKRIRDAVGGEDAIKASGKVHLPKPSGQDDYDYTQYLKRAMFYGASARTLQGLVGAIFRKSANVDAPKRMDELLDNITATGLPFQNFAKMATEEVITLGRAGILVDKPSEGEGSAYCRLYPAESIINWRTEVRDGREQLVQLVLHEERQVAGDDGFGTEFVNNYRVLAIDEDGFYNVTLYNEEMVEGDLAYSIEDELTPTNRGERFAYIPFVFLSPNDLTPPVSRSPILDLVNVNMSHYRTQADLEQGNYLTSSPTPYIIGQRNAENSSWSIGSGTIWFLNEGASTGMLEYGGGGLSYLEKSLDRKQSMMALLGARLLEESKRTAEAAETVRLRGSGESSILASIADTVSDGLQQALSWCAEWEGFTDTINVELNKDFMDARLTPQELQSLVSAWQSGAIGQADLLFNLQRGEMLRPDYSLEEIQDELDTEMPGAGDADEDDEDEPPLAVAAE